jgi:apolipoprotein N-acyltransferase
VVLAVLLFGGVRLVFFRPTAPSVAAATITLDNALSRQASHGIDWLSFNQSTDAERAAARPQFQATVDQMLARTETALRGGAKIVGWQEGAALVLEEDKQSTLERIASLAKEHDACVEVSLWVLTRTPDQHFMRNQSVLVDNTGATRWTYDKTYPVFPTESYLIVAGAGKLPIADTPYGRLSTAICNDLHFPPLLQPAGKQSVGILITPYDDIHPWETEDAVTAMYRAIEDGVSIVRPAGHGVSTIVDYQGHTLARQNYFTDGSGVMLGAVATQGVRTVYSRIGDLFAHLCVVGLVFLTSWAIFRGRCAALAMMAE